MRAMGSKTAARKLARELGVPMVPGTVDAVETDAAARATAREIGYPVMLKAAMGGGGKGMRLVHREADLAEALRAARAEAGAAFGDAAVYLERAVVEPRHIEIQVLADGGGRVIHLGERECSIQRRHQKLVEESPSPALDGAAREALEAAVERACRELGYVNAGTFEFLVGPEGEPCFIEVNCRLQVEHPVTELLTGVDIVREQLRVAAGEPLVATGRAARAGHAIEIRINAEDPARAFAPAPGVVTRFRPPLGPGVRVDTSVSDGAVIPPQYDSLLAKVIVADATRDAAIARAERALGELEVEGIPTTRELALDILRSEAFRSGSYSTRYLAEMGHRLPSLSST
jgi:acetyl-CoA carboxylase biotin carboxylase subunit